MTFLQLLQRRSAPRPPSRWATLGLQSALIWGLCNAASVAQTQATDPAQDAIKKALQAGQLDQAQKLVLQAREAAPKNVQWQFMEGVIQAQQGQTDKAIDTFKKITEAHPDLSEAFNNLGVLYAAKGRLEESRAYLEKALQTHPSYAAAHRNLSDVLSQLAKDSYGKALQVDPKVRASTPQLTLLGSIASEKRLPVSLAKANLPSSVAASATVNPATPGPAQAAASAPVTGSTVKPASTAVAATVAAAPVSAVPDSPVASAAKTLLASPKAASQASAPASVAAIKPAPPAAALAPVPTMPAKPTAVATAPALPPVAAQAAPKAAAASTPSTPTAAAAPVQPQTNAPADQVAVKSAVLSWAKAWSQKDMNRYLAAYASNFHTGNMTRAKWEADRQLKILSKKTISVHVNQLQIDVKGDKATARFQQIYTSDYFQGNSRKTLELHKQGERWVIIRESVN